MVAALDADESWRGGTTAACDCCGNLSRRTWCMITSDGAPLAVFFASCYDHDEFRESWIDVVFGSWPADGEFTDHVTLGCRFGPVNDGEETGASLVAAAAVAPDSPLFGTKLSAAQASEHSLLPSFWEVVDYVLAADPLVRSHHCDHEPES